MGSDPALLRLWCGQVTTAQIQPLAWKVLYAVGVALKKKDCGAGQMGRHLPEAPLSRDSASFNLLKHTLRLCSLIAFDFISSVFSNINC